MPKAGLGCFAVGDDVVGALGYAEPVDEEGVLAGQQPWDVSAVLSVAADAAGEELTRRILLQLPPRGARWPATGQAAERRYLRVRPGAPGATGEQRVQATRSRRAARCSVSAWARTNAAHLRQLAGQITALDDLPIRAQQPLARLTEALADNDAANLIGPLSDTHVHLLAGHPDLAARIDFITRNTARLHNGSTHG
ncbi:MULTISPECIES: type III effector protein [unclassified Streptomyces]|uniref:type III effector protein n=1 Tax=unclassified Streptomyces TaxID=2593676 RepID=UPI0033E54D06